MATIEEVVMVNILPNQIVELTEHIIRGFGAYHAWNVGKAKCAHVRTFYAYGREDELNKGVGVTELRFDGYSALVKGEREGYIAIQKNKGNLDETIRRAIRRRLR